MNSTALTSVSLFLEHRIDGATPACPKCCNHFFRTRRAPRQHLIKRVEEQRFVEAIAVEARPVLQSDARNRHHLPRGFKQGMLAEINAKAARRHSIPQ